jgi:hypothetical protein
VGGLAPITLKRARHLEDSRVQSIKLRNRDRELGMKGRVSGPDGGQLRSERLDTEGRCKRTTGEGPMVGSLLRGIAVGRE